MCASVRLTITGDLSLASLAAFRMCTKEKRFETTSKKEEKITNKKAGGRIMIIVEGGRGGCDLCVIETFPHELREHGGGEQYLPFFPLGAKKNTVYDRHRPFSSVSKISGLGLGLGLRV